MSDKNLSKNFYVYLVYFAQNAAKQAYLFFNYNQNYLLMLVHETISILLYVC